MPRKPIDPSWLQLAPIVLWSGRKSFFKVECDNLTDEEVDSACALLVKILRPFGAVTGVPTGGLRLERAMQPYATKGPLLVVDDVWTTGGSMERHIASLAPEMGYVGARAVIFARGSYPVSVTALWTLDSRLWNA